MNIFSDDLDLADQSAVGLSIEAAVASGLQEGFRFEAKAQFDSDKVVKTVCAFANTFGGVLLLGVSIDKKTLAVTSPGIEGPTGSDLKTRAVNVITANISPAPAFEVWVGPGGEAGKHLVLIRVRPQANLHMIVRTDGSNPVYIRVGDSSKGASALELSSLIDRVQAKNTILSSTRPQLPYQFMNRVTIKGGDGSRTESPTKFEIVIWPSEAIRLPLDRVRERHFKQQTHHLFGVALGNPKLTSWIDEDRGADWYQVRSYFELKDFESHWAMTSAGTVFFNTQIACPDDEGNRYWSMADLTIFIRQQVRLVDWLWRTVGFYGEGYISCVLHANGLQPFRKGDSFVPAVFQATDWEIPTESIIKSETLIYKFIETGLPSATFDLSFADRNEGNSGFIASLLNRMLRTLRYSVDPGRLTEVVAKIPR